MEREGRREMKRKTEVVELFTLRDLGGELILAMRIAAARKSLSMNEWLLQVVREATRETK
jgi:predicted HicB family RNase H-like nuclease